ncbi:MAG: efflux RND transporter periplasmic adaptor subunit, partial [Pseudomonadota bacterium]
MKNWKPLILSIAIAAGWSVDKAQASDIQPTFVTTYIVEDAKHESTRRFLGVMAAKDTVTLSFQVGGQLLDLDAIEGSVIEEGASLAALDLAPFERAVRRAEISLEQAARDLARNQKLVETNAVSAVALENALTTHDLAVVALQDAKKALSDAQLFAPFPSLVADRIGVPFATIEPGQPVVRLHDVSEMRVELNVPERFVQGFDVTTLDFAVEIPGFPDPFDAEFKEIRTEASLVGQNYLVNLSIPAKAGRLFVPGSTVTVVATIRSLEVLPKAPSVPSSAII